MIDNASTNRFIDILAETVGTTCNCYSKENMIKFMAYFQELKCGLRLQYITVELIEQRIWPDLRKDETLMDMIVSCSQQFMFRLEIDDVSVDALRKKLSQSITEVADRSGVTDTDFRSKLGYTGNLTQLLKSENWLFTLLCIVMFWGSIVGHLTDMVKAN